MRNTVRTLASNLALFCLLLGPAMQSSAAVAQEMSVDNPELRRTVEEAFERHPLLSVESIDVAAEGSVVRLSGEVSSIDARSTAESVAAAVGGVLAVENDLVTQASVGSEPERRREGTSRSEGDRLAEPPAESSDLDLLSDVVAELRRSRIVDATSVQVQANEGNVLLSGVVASGAARAEAIEIARKAGASGVDASRLGVAGSGAALEERR